MTGDVDRSRHAVRHRAVVTESPESGAPDRGEWPLADTVKPYFRHLLACTGVAEWSARIEEADGLLGKMARDVRSLGEVRPLPPKLTATDEPSTAGDLDLLVFPEAIRYHGVDERAWTSVLRDHVGAGRVARVVPTTTLVGRHVFVCVHRARDERCGCWGPPVLETLREACRAEGLDVPVRATSHVGGHKYAGNVLIYPEGIWYGYVRPGDAATIVREHLVGGRTVKSLLRGRMIAGGCIFPNRT